MKNSTGNKAPQDAFFPPNFAPEYAPVDKDVARVLRLIEQHRERLDQIQSYVLSGSLEPAVAERLLEK